MLDSRMRNQRISDKDYSLLGKFQKLKALAVCCLCLGFSCWHKLCTFIKLESYGDIKLLNIILPDPQLVNITDLTIVGQIMFIPFYLVLSYEVNMCTQGQQHVHRKFLLSLQSFTSLKLFEVPGETLPLGIVLLGV